MALVDKIFHDRSVLSPSEFIPNHPWSAALWFFSKGVLTRNDIVSKFNLTTEDEVQLDLLITHYQGLSATEKSEFHSSLEAAGILAERGYITKNQYKAFLGLI